MARTIATIGASATSGAEDPHDRDQYPYNVFRPAYAPRPRAFGPLGTQAPLKAYGVPGPGMFEGGEYLEAPDLAAIGRRIIGEYSELAHLRADAPNGHRIMFLWKAKGGNTGGKAKLGQCVKASPLVDFLVGGVEFLVILSADHVRAMGLAGYQVEALLYHELLHADETEDGKPTLAPHDVTAFQGEIRRYGAWMQDLKDTAKSFKQLELIDDGASHGLTDERGEPPVARSAAPPAGAPPAEMDQLSMVASGV